VKRAVLLVVALSVVGCSSSTHLTIESVVEDYLEAYATGPACLTSDPWWCDGERKRPSDGELKRCATLVVVRQTANFNLGTSSQRGWPEDALADLWRQRGQSNELGLKQAAHLPVVLIDQNEVQDLDPCKYFEMYPGAPKILEFSNVGFSGDGKSAVFVVSTRGWPGGTTGILASWSNGRWGVVDHEAQELY